VDDSIARRGSLAQRLGLERFIVECRAGESKTMIRDPWLYGELDWDCPHCGFPVHLELLDSANDDGTNWQPHAAGIEQTNRDPDHPQRIIYLVCCCPRSDCRGIIFAVGDASTRKVKEAYPYVRATADSFPSSIPGKIRADFAEATRCFYAQAYKGSVALSRRAFQNIAKERGITSRNLDAQIREMHDKGLITASLFGAAQEIRQFGAFGAHPQDDELDDVTGPIAESILEFVNQFMEHLYVMTAKTAALAKKRQEAKQKP